jgi:cell division protein FtsL
MRRLSILFVALLVVSLFFMGTWQGFRYQQLVREVRALEEEQKSWLEKNKKLIAGLAVFNSPERIEHIARDELKLNRIDNSRVIKVVSKGESIE